MNILVIDDEKPVCESMLLFLSELGHEVACAYDGQEGIELFERKRFHLVFTDITMPKLNGFELLRRIKQNRSSLVDVVIISGHGDVESAITALREGAYDYLQKPINVDELAIVVERVQEHLSLRMTTEELTTQFEEKVKERISEAENKLEKYRNIFRENIGLNRILIHSRKMREIYALSERFHRSPSVPVLIEGETGTGKELLARYIHYGPAMVAKPFIAINCAAIPGELFESELFGHESGAFTGSSSTSKKGQMEIAEDGTLLLDEIGEMPMSMQVKLLRVLEEREFYRVGGIKRIAFRARIVASTNKSLLDEVERKQFRSDLYHRLNVGYIEIPPLRERREEVIPLIYDFLHRSCERHGNRNIRGFTTGAERFLENLPWPGNVRQLENAIERAVLLFDSPLLEADHFDFLVRGSSLSEIHAAAPVISLPEGPAPGRQGIISIPEEGIDLDELITNLIKEAMRVSGGKKTLAAKLLNISPRTISRRLDKDEVEE
ncbi:MAG: sigma-54-dependent transcriptional regulator [Candidatus Latescibacterota bacterium]